MRSLRITFIAYIRPLSSLRTWNTCARVPQNPLKP